jgi:hypothetical protein
MFLKNAGLLNLGFFHHDDVIGLDQVNRTINLKLEKVDPAQGQGIEISCT